MSLSQAQQQELQQLLDSPIFKAAKEEVLRMTDGSVEGLDAPEAGIKMALEKGARNAFRVLAVIAKSAPANTPLKPRSLNSQQ
jgi:hypothetical protein